MLGGGDGGGGDGGGAGGGDGGGGEGGGCGGGEGGGGEGGGEGGGGDGGGAGGGDGGGDGGGGDGGGDGGGWGGGGGGEWRREVVRPYPSRPKHPLWCSGGVTDDLEILSFRLSIEDSDLTKSGLASKTSNPKFTSGFTDKVLAFARSEKLDEHGTEDEMDVTVPDAEEDGFDEEQEVSTQPAAVFYANATTKRGRASRKS